MTSAIIYTVDFLFCSFFFFFISPSLFCCLTYKRCFVSMLQQYWRLTDLTVCLRAAREGKNPNLYISISGDQPTQAWRSISSVLLVRWVEHGEGYHSNHLIKTPLTWKRHYFLIWARMLNVMEHFLFFLYWYHTKKCLYNC